MYVCSHPDLQLFFSYVLRPAVITCRFLLLSFSRHPDPPVPSPAVSYDSHLAFSTLTYSWLYNTLSHPPQSIQVARLINGIRGNIAIPWRLGCRLLYIQKEI